MKIKLRNFLAILNMKMGFYKAKGNEQAKKDIAKLLEKSCHYLNSISLLTSLEKSHSLFDLEKQLKIGAIVLYATPEASDTMILHNYLEITDLSSKNGFTLQLPYKFRLDRIYLALCSDNFCCPLTLQKKLDDVSENFKGRHQFTFSERTTSFFLSFLGVSEKADQLELKCVKRFDKAVEKLVDYFVFANSKMQTEELGFRQLTLHDQQNIKASSAKLAAILSSHGLLMDGANYAAFLNTVDELWGGFIKSFDKISFIKPHHLKIISRQFVSHIYETLSGIDEKSIPVLAGAETQELPINCVLRGIHRAIIEKTLQIFDELITQIRQSYMESNVLFVHDTTAYQRENWERAVTRYLTLLDENLADGSELKPKNKRQPTIFEAKLRPRILLIDGLNNFAIVLERKLSEQQQGMFFAPILLKTMEQITSDLNTHTAQWESHNFHVAPLENFSVMPVSSIDIKKEQVKKEFFSLFVSSFKKIIAGNAAYHHLEIAVDQHQPTAVTVTKLEKYVTTLKIGLSPSSTEKVIADTLTQTLCPSEQENPRKSIRLQQQITTKNQQELDAFTKARKRIISVSTRASDLVPAEDIKKRGIIAHTSEDHTHTIRLYQCTLQQVKLFLLEDKSGYLELETPILFTLIDQSIVNLEDTVSTLNINPMDILCNAIILSFQCQENTKISLTISEIKEHFHYLQQRCEKTLQENFSKQSPHGWRELLTRTHEKTVLLENNLKLWENKSLTPEQKTFVISAIKALAKSLLKVSQTGMCSKLNPSIHTVTLHLQAMSLHLGCFAASNRDHYLIFEDAVRIYNIHFKSLSEHMAFFITSKANPQSDAVTALDNSFNTVSKMMQSRELVEAFLAFQEIASTEGGSELLEQFSKETNKILNSGFFERYLGGKKGQLYRLFQSIGNFCSGLDDHITGGFVFGVSIIFLYQSAGNTFMRALQRVSSTLLENFNNIQHLLNRFEEIIPNFRQTMSALYSQPSGQIITGNTSCYHQILQNHAGALSNVTLEQAIGQTEQTIVQIFQLLFYEINTCPSGGKDSFIPNLFINPGNTVTTVVSVIAGVFAMRGWKLGIDQFTQSALEHQSLVTLTQEFSPKITESLMLEAAKQSSNDSTRQKIYQNASWTEKTLDVMDSLFHKTTPTQWRGSKIVNFLTEMTRYITPLRGVSMAVPQRLHSMDEILVRLLLTADRRKKYTDVRMKFYNFFKDGVDVFSTKSYVILYFTILKEIDIPIAFAEKSAIANYQVAKNMHKKLLQSLHSLSTGVKLDTYQRRYLESIYGSEAIREILGENIDIEAIENETQQIAAQWIETLMGVGFTISIVIAHAVHFYYFTLSPYQMAQRTLAKIQTGSMDNSVTEDLYHELIKKARGTIAREFNPNDLNDSQVLLHFLGASRSISKIESSFMHWAIKELINLSMYLNGSAAERRMGITRINFELLGAFIAYLLKDSTGMASRVAMLLSSDQLRTLLSIADKLDSPFAEWLLQRISQLELPLSTSTVLMTDSLIKDVLTKGAITGQRGIRDIHHQLNSKLQQFCLTGLKPVLHATQLQEDAALKLVPHDSILKVDSDISWEGQTTPIKTMQGAHDDEESMMLPLMQDDRRISFHTLSIQFIERLQEESLYHGKPLSREKLLIYHKLENFISDLKKPSYGFDYSDPNQLIILLARLVEEIPEEVLDYYVTQKILTPLRFLEPQQKNQVLIERLRQRSGRKDRPDSSSLPPTTPLFRRRVTHESNI